MGGVITPLHLPLSVTVGYLEVKDHERIVEQDMELGFLAGIYFQNLEVTK